MSYTFRVDCDVKPLMIQARGNSKTESAKVRNRRLQKKVRYHPSLYFSSVYFLLKGMVFVEGGD